MIEKEEVIKQPEIKGDLIVTLNQMGYMFPRPEKFIQHFIDFSAKQPDPVLDIGAAYGVATIPALEKGAHVVATDMDERHLAILKSKVPPPLLSHLELKIGKMPSDLDFPENHFGAILASRILHFVDPNLIKECLFLIHKWLKPAGKFFYIGGTPYLGTYRNFLPQYEKNKQQGREWPGWIENMKDYVAPEQTAYLPPFINLIDEEILKKIMKEAGFKIEEMDYIPFGEAHSKDMRLDGREHLGAIAVKV